MNKKWKPCFNLDYRAAQTPDKKAIITEHDSITYSELRDLSIRAAAALAEQDIRSGDTVLVFMPNCIAYAVMFYASVRLNLNIVLANIFYKDSELTPLIRTTDPTAAFIMEEREEQVLLAAAPELPVVNVPAFLHTLPDLADIHPELLSGRSSGEASISISTSGSTGTPKAVENTYLNEQRNACLYAERMEMTPADIVLSALPATQRFGLAAMLGSCISGATCILLPRFSAEYVLTVIESYRVTVQYGVPTMFLKEIDALKNQHIPSDLSSLRTGIVAGANCSENIFRWFEIFTGCRLLNCYGTSEIGGLTMTRLNDPIETRYNTCGQVFSDAVLRITDSEGNILPPETIGEITCQVPWIMNGYGGAPEQTLSRFNPDGFFRTGDIGKLDKNGNLMICGRKKDLIIRGGYNIFPAELERVMLKLPYIHEACVIGYQDSLLGERIAAFIRSSDPGLSCTSVRAALSRHIAKYKLPDHIICMDRIPKLPNGKYDYPALKQLLEKTKTSTEQTE